MLLKRLDCLYLLQNHLSNRCGTFSPVLPLVAFLPCSKRPLESMRSLSVALAAPSLLLLISTLAGISLPPGVPSTSAKSNSLCTCCSHISATTRENSCSDFNLVRLKHHHLCDNEQQWLFLHHRHQSLPTHQCILQNHQLRLKSPATPVGLCAVVPTGILIDPVPLKSTPSQ